MEKIPIACSRCKTRFREKVSRLRDGYQAECPSCGKFINFSSESDDPQIRRAMTEARRIRNGVVLPKAESEVS